MSGTNPSTSTQDCDSSVEVLANFGFSETLKGQQPPPPNPKPKKKLKKKKSQQQQEPKKMGTIGALPSFDQSKDNFEMWYATFESFLTANDLSVSSAEAKCKGILLSSIGLPTYTLLSHLLSPTAPASASVAKIEKTLKAHFTPAPKALAERFKFTGRKQQTGESVHEYVAALRSLAIHCNFHSDLETRIRDQFIFGISSEATQRALFTKDDNVALKDVIALAVAQEAAEQSTALVRGHAQPQQPTSSEQVNKTYKFNKSQQGFKNKSKKEKKANQQQTPTTTSTGNKPTTSTPTECKGCGGQHSRSKCKFLESLCHTCGVKGHIAKVCRSNQKKNNHVSLESLSDIHQVNKTSSRLITVEVKINNIPHTMELDTGCECSLLSEEFWKNQLNSPPLAPSTTVFRTYTKDCFSPLGNLQATVEHEGQQVKTSIPVSPGTSLFGRDFLRLFTIDWVKVKQQCHKVSEGTQSQLQHLLNEYEDVFSAPTSANPIKEFKARIILKDTATPRFLKARPIPYAILPEVDKALQQMEDTGVISKVETSEWASPLVVVPKSDGRVRITGDFKNTVNSQLCVTQYPLALPDDLLAGVAGGSTFSKLDGTNAYHQIQLEEQSKKFLVVNTHRGLYQYNFLPMGIASAPAIFQHFMDNMLRDIPNTGSFIDDAITSAPSDADHLTHLKTIFERMRKYNYKLCKPKCQFMQPSIEFLGHQVSKNGISTSPSKVAAVSCMSVPKDVTQVKSFLGLVNFYGKFCKNLSTICEPLYHLTRKDTPFNWTQKCTDAFNTVKKLLPSSPTLAHYDPTKLIGISTDASSIGLGAVLFIKEDGKEYPVAFASKLLSDTERRYSQIEKEGLAIIYAIKKFYKYVCGRHFLLITDHRPLLTIFGPKSQLPPFVATRLHHWSLFLSQFKYKVEYRKSEDNGNADALSRLPLTAPSTPSQHEICVHAIAAAQLEVLPVTAAQIRKQTVRDPILCKVQQLILYGWPQNLRKEDKELQPYFTRRYELSVIQGVVMWGIRVVIPDSLQQQVLSLLHDSHLGIVKMKSLARQHVYFPGIDKKIEEIAKSCTSCQKSASDPPSAPLHPWQFPEQPWQRLHIDLAGLFLNRMWFIIIDAHTKWPEVFCMNSNTTTTAILTRIQEVISRFGLPEQIVSDNGRQFTSAEFEEFCKNYSIKHSLSSVYHPRSNGEAERFVRTFKEAMKHNEHSIDVRLQRFLFSYRTTTHSTTGSAPAELMLCRKPRTPLTLAKPDVSKTARNSQLTQEQTYNARVKVREFQPEDAVWVKTFIKGEEKWSPATVKQKIGPVTYLLSFGDRDIKRHIDQIRSRHQSSPPPHSNRPTSAADRSLSSPEDQPSP